MVGKSWRDARNLTSKSDFDRFSTWKKKSYVEMFWFDVGYFASRFFLRRRKLGNYRMVSLDLWILHAYALILWSFLGSFVWFWITQAWFLYLCNARKIQNYILCLAWSFDLSLNLSLDFGSQALVFCLFAMHARSKITQLLDCMHFYLANTHHHHLPW